MFQNIFRLYTFSLVVQLLIYIPYVVRAVQFSQSASSIALRMLDCVARATPPGAPAAMLFGGGFSRGRLKAHGIDLVFPSALGTAAATSIVCFDKTGTLTGSVVIPFTLFTLLVKAAFADQCCGRMQNQKQSSSFLTGSTHLPVLCVDNCFCQDNVAPYTMSSACICATLELLLSMTTPLHQN